MAVAESSVATRGADAAGVDLQATVKTGTINALTGLRGIAAYAVLLAHALDSSFYYAAVPIFHPADARLAYFGMSLFFVLSGFVIYYNYAKRFRETNIVAATYEFIVARFARLYPLYAVSILLAFTYIPSRLFANDLPTALSYLTLTQSWSNREQLVFPPDWSISTEWFFYLAFIPLTFVIIPIARPVRALLLYLGLTFVALLGLYSFPQVFEDVVAPFTSHPGASADPWTWISYYSPYIRVLEFCAGALAARAYMSGQRSAEISPARLRTLLTLCIAWCVAIVVLPTTGFPAIDNLLSNFIFAPALAPLMFLCCSYNSAVARFLATKPLLFMGQISYSVYIWGWSVMTLYGPQFLSPAPSPLAYLNSIVKVIIIVTVTTILAYGSYLLIEAPSREWIRSHLSGRLRRLGIASADRAH